jgi:hypothetical protein
LGFKDAIALALVVARAAIGTGGAPNASAYSTVHRFGTDGQHYDAGGAVGTAWTIRDLEPGRDYPLAGRLWPVARSTST